MPSMLFYQEPVPLNREAHKNLKLKRTDSLSFTRELNSVPVSGPEFFEVGRDMPILFGKDNEQGEYFPAALLSLLPAGHNLGDDWGELYLPAFIRRYPFALANDGVLVFDKQAEHLQEEEGEPLFNEDGSNSEMLDKIIRFVHEMDRHYKATREYCRVCAEQQLFTPYNRQVDAGQEKPVRLDNLFAIDQKKLHELSDERVTEWFRKGWLAWSYAHLHSLGALGRLVSRERRTAGTAAQAGETAEA